VNQRKPDSFHPAERGPSKSELNELNALATELKSIPTPKRSKAAKKAGYAIVQAHRPYSMPVSLPWKLGLIASPLVIIFVAVIVLSQSAMPGDSLYSLKQSTENIRSVAIIGPEAKARNCSKLMKRRADELARHSEKTYSTSQIVALNQAIIVEAQEFQDFIAESGNDKNSLEELRQRDIQYVLDALEKVDASSLDEKARNSINDTTERLKGLREPSLS